PGAHAITLPRLAAGPAGHVGAVYYAGATADAQDLTAYATQATEALDPQPTFTSAALNDPAHPIFQNYAFNASPRADYVGAAYDSDGNLWAGVVRQLGKPAGDSTAQTT